VVVTLPSGQAGALDNSALAGHALVIPAQQRPTAMDESKPPAEPVDAGTGASPESASVILASFQNSDAAERMVSSLGAEVRHKAREGDVNGFVIRRNRDGSFKLVQSRVLTAGGIGVAVIGFTTATMAGFLGMGPPCVVPGR